MKIIASLVLYKHSYEDIKVTLDSLLNEPDVEKIVLVDNGAHCDWVAKLNIPKVDSIINKINRGFGAGHNSVFSAYNGQADYFLLCNPDIWFEAGEITKLCQFCIDNSVDLSIPKIFYPDGTQQYACKLLPDPLQLFVRRFLQKRGGGNGRYELRHADYTKSFFAPFFSGCCLLLSEAAVSLSGGFDERFFLYLEDVDLSRRISDSPLKVACCPLSVVYHEAQRKSYYNGKFLFYHLVSALKYFNKWGWFYDQGRKRLNKKCLEQIH